MVHRMKESCITVSSRATRPGVTDGGVSALLCLIDFILYRRPDTLVRHRA